MSTNPGSDMMSFNRLARPTAAPMNRARGMKARAFQLSATSIHRNKRNSSTPEAVASARRLV